MGEASVTGGEESGKLRVTLGSNSTAVHCSALSTGLRASGWFDDVKAVAELMYLGLGDFSLGVAELSEWPAGFPLPLCARSDERNVVRDSLYHGRWPSSCNPVYIGGILQDR